MTPSDAEKMNKTAFEAIYGLLKAYHDTPSDDYEAKTRDWIKESLKWAIRIVEKFITPRASAEAQRLADSMGLNCLSQYGWLQQTTKMKDKSRKIFHFDHFYTVSNIRDELLAITLTNPQSDLNEIERIITKMDVFWITKEENQHLDALGYRSKRPSPEEAYMAAGIEILEINAKPDGQTVKNNDDAN